MSKPELSTLRLLPQNYPSCYVLELWLKGPPTGCPRWKHGSCAERAPGTASLSQFSDRVLPILPSPSVLQPPTLFNSFLTS